MKTDLNGDASDDWLVWPVAQVEPILFALDHDVYHVSRPSISRPDDKTRIVPQLAPDGGTMLLDRTYLGSQSGTRRCSNAETNYNVH